MTRSREEILQDLAREEARLSEAERMQQAARARLASLRRELEKLEEATPSATGSLSAPSKASPDRFRPTDGPSSSTITLWKCLDIARGWISAMLPPERPAGP